MKLLDTKLTNVYYFKNKCDKYKGQTQITMENSQVWILSSNSMS